MQRADAGSRSSLIGWFMSIHTNPTRQKSGRTKCASPGQISDGSPVPLASLPALSSADDGQGISPATERGTQHREMDQVTAPRVMPSP